MHAPTDVHIDQCITLLQYLHSTSRHKLTYYANEHPIVSQLKLYGEKNSDLLDLVVSNNNAIEGNQLCGMSDADYASMLEEEKSLPRASASSFVTTLCAGSQNSNQYWLHLPMKPNSSQ